MRTDRPVLAVTGLAAEARIAAGSGVMTVAGGGDPARLALLIQGALSRGARAVISFGIAGGLQPGLVPGTAVIGRAVENDLGIVQADPAWVRRLADKLPGALVADLAGVDGPVCDPAGKAALRRRTGAVAVDMESHVAARLAALHQVPFAALRIIADPAERAIPAAAALGMRADGTTDVGAVVRALGRKPGDLPALIRTALDARAAFAALLRTRRSLCSLFGFGDQHPEGLEEGVFGFPLGHLDLGTGLPSRAGRPEAGLQLEGF